MAVNIEGPSGVEAGWTLAPGGKPDVVGPPSSPVSGVHSREIEFA
jgi:hypothetical protein